MDEALRFSQSHGVRAGCQALDLPPSSLYREKLRRERPAMDPRPRPASPRALSPPEKEAVVEVLHSQRFVDKAPATVWAELLDEGRYLCSIRTMSVPRRRYVRLCGGGALRCGGGGALQRRGPGNGPRHPHLHHPAGVSGSREDVSGVDEGPDKKRRDS